MARPWGISRNLQWAPMRSGRGMRALESGQPAVSISMIVNSPFTLSAMNVPYRRHRLHLQAREDIRALSIVITPALLLNRYLHAQVQW